MAKAAGEALAFALAKEELQNGVRVNIVAPALTVSDMGEKLSRAITGQDDIQHLASKMPFGRVAVPADVAAAVVWFGSDANSYCSGQKLNIDGAGQATFRLNTSFRRLRPRSGGWRPPIERAAPGRRQARARRADVSPDRG